MKKGKIILLNILGILILLLITVVVVVSIYNNKGKKNEVKKENQVENKEPDMSKELNDFGYELFKENRIDADMATDNKLLLTFDDLTNVYGFVTEKECNPDKTSIEITFDEKGQIESTYTSVDCLEEENNEEK